jgi:fructan beta-fructosidase
MAVLLFHGPPAIGGEPSSDDLLIADFEGDDYGNWEVSGTAFGKGPARGTLPGQMPVSGFEGNGLVNSFHEGDGSTGTLTSPPFKLERRYLNFLVGGGAHAGETCINLLIDGNVVRTATGPNSQPGGSEQLEWHTWNVEEFAGKRANIQIVDRHTGGWGHINVDSIAQSGRSRQARPASRSLKIDARFLRLPVKTGARSRRMRLAIEGKTIREFEIELAEGAPDFWVFADLAEHQGAKLAVEVNALSPGMKALDALSLADDAVGEPLYEEPGRPRFHFTSRRGWLNDPNGLVFHEGEFHLFYQHNPYGLSWGNMHWGHAVSTDLVHWRELPIALYPARYGDWAFSGSALVDHQNSSGFGMRENPAIVAAFTSTGRGECIVFSTDGGRTWREFDGNPVLRHAGRDPRLLWHAPTRRWVLAVYDEHQGKQWIAFHSSANLKDWRFESRIEGFFECPDLVELPVAGTESRAWVLYGADGKYLVGQFDGSKFTPDGRPKQQLWHGNFYAAQTFSNAPRGRVIQIGWANGVTFPGMPFNQQMTVPCQLTLRQFAEGARCHAWPVEELQVLRGNPLRQADCAVEPGANAMLGDAGRFFDAEVEFDAGDAHEFGLIARGARIVYDARKQELVCRNVRAPLPLSGGRLQLRLLVDAGSIELFAHEGAVAISVGLADAAARPPPAEQELEAFAVGGRAVVRHAALYPMRSSWRLPAR